MVLSNAELGIPWPTRDPGVPLDLLWDENESLRATVRQGQPLVKIPEDLARYQLLLSKTAPDLIVECGTWRGASAVWFAEETRADVLTIDVEDFVDQPLPNSVHRIIRSSYDPRTVQEVAEFVSQYDRVMVVLDADHRHSAVSAEIRAYASLVSPGCYLVVEDGHADFFQDFPEGGPLRAIEELLSGPDGSLWCRDTEIEGLYPVTMHPAGWLRRVE
jgi:cephalosporin hydroxylase